MNRGSKQWSRAIVKNQEEIKVFKVKRTRRGKYIVIINKTPIDYKVFYEEMEEKGLLKGRDNLILELRAMRSRNSKKKTNHLNNDDFQNKSKNNKNSTN